MRADPPQQQQQYGKLVEMRQRQAMIDRSDGALREHQRLTQSMTDEQRAALKGQGDVAGVPPMVQAAVRNAMARQKRELEDAGAQVQGRAVGRARGACGRRAGRAPPSRYNGKIPGRGPDLLPERFGAAAAAVGRRQYNGPRGPPRKESLSMYSADRIKLGR